MRDLAVLDPDANPPAQKCSGCGQWVGSSGHDCPSTAKGEHSANAIASGPPEPTTFDFIRRRDAAPDLGATFGQDIEPAGRYMSQVPDSSVFDDDLWERGNVTFHQPLYLDFGGGYEDDDNWKRRLSGHYGGKTGRELSQAVVDDGYDGIVTHDKYGTSETVDLTRLGQGGSRCPACGQWADDAHVCPEGRAEDAGGVLDSLNPTGTVFTGYDPTFRATAPLGDTITTLAETEGIAPDTDITVYRGVPKGSESELNPGDFITTNEQLARDYAGDGTVIWQTVKAQDILDDLDEPGGEEYIYRPSTQQCPDCGQFAGVDHVCPKAESSSDGGKDEIASLGATPFRGVGRTPREMVTDDPYFQSPEYADFQEHLTRLAAEHEVTVLDDQHALGLWEGEAEPASAVRVSGPREGVDALARDLSTRYQQDAVMVVRYDRDGPGSLHSYALRDGDDPEAVVSALQQAGIPGARVVDGRLEVASEDTQPTLPSLVQRFGEPEVHSITLDFVEKDDSNTGRAPFAGMSPGAAPGDGTTWGTVRGARDGLERRYPGVELLLQEKGGYVVLNSIKFPPSEQRSGTGTKVMEDLVAEADKNGWKMALTPDTSFGASSRGRLERFYRRFGFVPNKGRHKDYATTEAMVRQPRS